MNYFNHKILYSSRCKTRFNLKFILCLLLLVNMVQLNDCMKTKTCKAIK